MFLELGQKITDLDIEAMRGIFTLDLQQFHATLPWILKESMTFKM